MFNLNVGDYIDDILAYTT